MTYLLLNLVFLLTVLIWVPFSTWRPTRAWWITFVAVIVLTLIFDPVIISLGIVDYNINHIIGIRILGAPIEDLFYAVYAVLIVPLIWHTRESKHGTDHSTT